MALDCWRYSQENAVLQKEIITANYGRLNHWCTKPVRAPHGTGIWKNINRLWDDYSSNTYFQMGDGVNTKLWTDKWIEDTTLKEAFPNIFLIAGSPELHCSKYREQLMEPES